MRTNAGVSSAPHARSVPEVGCIMALHAFCAALDMQFMRPPVTAVKSGTPAAVTLHDRQQVD